MSKEIVFVMWQNAENLECARFQSDTPGKSNQWKNHDTISQMTWYYFPALIHLLLSNIARHRSSQTIMTYSKGAKSVWYLIYISSNFRHFSLWNLGAGNVPSTSLKDMMYDWKLAQYNTNINFSLLKCHHLAPYSTQSQKTAQLEG